MTDRLEERSPIAEHLASGVSASELAHVWTAIEARRHRKPWRASLVWALALAAAVILAIVGTSESPDSLAEPGPIHVSGGGALAGSLGDHTRLDDGSYIEIAPGGSIEVLANDDHQLGLHLREGGARFSVAPGGPRRWRIEGGGVSVEVVGTVFSVRRDGAQVHVETERGVVVVRGAEVPDGVRRLGAGESIDVGEPSTEVVDAAPTPTAHDVIERVAPVSIATDGAARMLDEADRARREGRADDAIATLTRIVTRYPRAPEAPLAAFTRARLLASSGRDAEARSSYEQALVLGLPAPLAAAAREALAP